ncbi:N-acetyltransferase [Bacillus sp. JCM 19041]|uniref:N-acetyltransferase n=1 Tax=Bacillus sp. JCM 19041 TaxID=1460637 RepID=UPI0006CFED24
MIREAKMEEIDQLTELWYRSSVKAHHFIKRAYWESQKDAMKERYFPMSETYVVTLQEDIVGFLSMVDDYMAALFVDESFQGEGYGKEFVRFIKGRRENITLKVYKKNSKAVHFYKKHGFVVVDEFVDQKTSEQEYLMEWVK